MPQADVSGTPGSSCCPAPTPRGCPQSCVPAATLPTELLAAILLTTCEPLQGASAHLTNKRQLAQLVQLASVCRHWHAAAGHAVRQHGSQIRLPCHCLTPALKDWAAHWTSLKLLLYGSHVLQGLEDFMRSTLALTDVELGWRTRSACKATYVDAVSQALAVAPALQELTYSMLQPTAFARSRTHLTFGYGINWLGGKLEDLMEDLQQLLLLQELEIDLSCGQVTLSKERLEGVQLPEGMLLHLFLHEFDPDDKTFDLSWLSEARNFELCFVLGSNSSDDELLGFSQAIQPVLQEGDSLFLQQCNSICEPAQQILSGLQLLQFKLRIRDLSSIVVLPYSNDVILTHNVLSSELYISEGEDDTPTFSTSLSWDAIRSASVQCKVIAEFDELSEGEQSKCSAYLQVSGTPVGSTAWQQSLAEPDETFVAR